MYLITAIENLGDMIFHIRRESDDSNIKNVLIKYCKYLYRIYFCLAKSGDNIFKEKADLIKKHVLPFRKNFNIKKASQMGIFKFIFYQEKMQLEQYIKNVVQNVLIDINLFIEKIQ